MQRIGLIFPQTTIDLPLVEIRRISGLEPLSPDPLAVEPQHGIPIGIYDLPDARDFAVAVAKAAGLRIPMEPVPLAVRLKHQLDSAGTTGALLGLLAIVALLLAIALGAASPALSTAALAFLLSILPPVALGLSLGWLAGSLATLNSLRLVVPPEEIRAMFELDPYSGQGAYRKADLTPWARPILIRLASRVYGQPIQPRSRGVGQVSGGQ